MGGGGAFGIGGFSRLGLRPGDPVVPLWPLPPLQIAPFAKAGLAVGRRGLRQTLYAGGPLEKHKAIAIVIFLGVSTLCAVRDGREQAIGTVLILALFLIPIMFYRVIALLSSFGFPEVFAKDYGSENHPGPYAFFFWILFLIACCFIVFEWSLY